MHVHGSTGKVIVLLWTNNKFMVTLQLRIIYTAMLISLCYLFFQKFNEYLDELTEHYDIPKVSWTKWLSPIPCIFIQSYCLEHLVLTWHNVCYMYIKIVFCGFVAWNQSKKCKKCTIYFVFTLFYLVTSNYTVLPLICLFYNG